MYQQTCVLGRLGQDPELKTFDNGRSLCRFSLAVTEKWKDKNGVQKEATEWFKCNLWGNGAETFSQYTAKGSLVFVVGKLKTRSYEADNQKKFVTELNVENFKFVSSPVHNHTADNMPAFDDDSEIPF